MTKFVNLPDNSENYGYRIWDDLEQDYANHWELPLPQTEAEILNKVASDASETGERLLDWAKEYGCYISDNWFSSEEVRQILGEKEDESLI
jgi:hypothetical protein